MEAGVWGQDTSTVQVLLLYEPRRVVHFQGRSQGSVSTKALPVLWQGPRRKPSRLRMGQGASLYSKCKESKMPSVLGMHISISSVRTIGALMREKQRDERFPTLGTESTTKQS